MSVPAAGRILRFILRAVLFGAALYGLWIPAQSSVMVLLAEGSERVLWILERPPVITALAPRNNTIVVYSCITGTNKETVSWDAESLHIYAIASLALVLAFPVRRWSSRVKLAGWALLAALGVMLSICVVQLKSIMENYSMSSQGLTLHTPLEKTILDWSSRALILVGMSLLPALFFLIAYLSAGQNPSSPDADPKQASGTGNKGAASPSLDAGSGRVGRVLPVGKKSRGWISMRAAAIGVAVLSCVGLLLAFSHPESEMGKCTEPLRRIVALNPGSTKARFNLALNEEQAGNLDEARESYQAALGQKPDFVEARFNLGNVFYTKGDLDLATGCYEEVLRLQPDHISARNNLGSTLLKRGLFELAAQEFEEVLRQDERHASAHKNLGLTLLDLSQPCAALAHFERAVGLDAQLGRNSVLTGQISRLKQTCQPE